MDGDVYVFGADADVPALALRGLVFFGEVDLNHLVLIVAVLSLRGVANDDTLVLVGDILHVAFKGAVRLGGVGGVTDVVLDILVVFGEVIGRDVDSLVDEDDLHTLHRLALGIDDAAFEDEVHSGDAVHEGCFAAGARTCRGAFVVCGRAFGGLVLAVGADGDALTADGLGGGFFGAMAGSEAEKAHGSHEEPVFEFEEFYFHEV